MICETAYVSGDQLEAGSPSDPSFWTIHPTVDRLLQFKHITNEFANEDWGNVGGTTNYCTTGESCTGHHVDDLVPFKIRVLLEGNYTDTYLTNTDLYTYSHPENYALPYIYDNFDWDHCAKAGFDFATQSNVTTGSRAINVCAQNMLNKLWARLPGPTDCVCIMCNQQ